MTLCCSHGSRTLYTYSASQKSALGELDAAQASVRAVLPQVGRVCVNLGLSSTWP